MSESYKLYVVEGSDKPIDLLLKHARYQTTSISEADFIVYPCLVTGGRDVRGTTAKIFRQYHSYDKKVIVFILSDYEGRYPFHGNLYLLRTSALADQLAINERILPYLWECKHEPFAPILPTDSPSIGFCGLVSKPRKKLVSAFENSALMNCNFIKRNSFWGGKPQDAGLRSDFWNNLQENQFALAPRGAGNFSMRFYQALSVGRIPVLINTNTALPFSNWIPWKKFIVLENTEEQCIHTVREIHEAGQVRTMQEMCYRIFHEYLSPRVFLARLLHQLKYGG